MGKNSSKTRPREHSAPPPFESEELHAVVERAYTVFSTYALVGPVDVCMACCVTQEEVNTLVRTPLRTVSAGLLSLFNDTAQSNTPSFDQLNYFLPRYFELLAARQVPSHSLEIALQRLTPFPSERWTVDERSCIDDFAIALFRAQLQSTAHQPFGWNATSVLLLFWRAGVDVGPLFAAWEASTSLTSLIELADLIVGYVDWTCEPPRFVASFAEEWMSAPLVAWIRSDSVRQHVGARLEAVLLGPSDVYEDPDNRLGWAYELLHPTV